MKGDGTQGAGVAVSVILGLLDVGLGARRPEKRHCLYITAVLAASERQVKSQTHIFLLQKKDKIKTWIIVKCCLFWI